MTGERDTYLDALRLLGLLGAAISWQESSLVLLRVGSLAVLFGVSGCLVGASLACSDGSSWPVLNRRLRRLLPPLWVLGTLLVLTMLVHGWRGAPTGTGDPIGHWQLLLFWVVPLASPAASEWGHAATEPLWWLGVYCWLLLLSPSLVWLYRRWPKRLLAAPLLIAALTTVGAIHAGSGRSSTVVAELGTYGLCWLIGIARATNTLRRLRPGTVLVLSAALVTAGLVWRHTPPIPNSGMVGLPETLLSAGIALIAMRVHPTQRRSVPAVAAPALRAVNTRLLTLCLWYPVALALSKEWDSERSSSTLAGLARRLDGWTAVLLALVAVVLFGWAEDFERRRRSIRTSTSTGQLSPSSRFSGLQMPGRPEPTRIQPAGVALVLLGCLTASAATVFGNGTFWPAPRSSSGLVASAPLQSAPSQARRPAPPAIAIHPALAAAHPRRARTGRRSLGDPIQRPHQSRYLSAEPRRRGLRKSSLVTRHASPATKAARQRHGSRKARSDGLR